MEAARSLEFGGVVVNDVPTFRADQQPYGGVRRSGNAREGPSYAIQEMTELKMVAIEA
jgi:acyl-CoA reductase-like NAD-dependent aldehyde dehydrogenase